MGGNTRLRIKYKGLELSKLAVIDMVLTRELHLQLKGQVAKMRTDAQLTAELGKLLSADGRQGMNQTVSAYRNYFNARSRGQGPRVLKTGAFDFGKPNTKRCTGLYGATERTKGNASLAHVDGLPRLLSKPRAVVAK